MHIKATIVACVYSVQCFENITIVAYASLRVKDKIVWYPGLPRSKHFRNNMVKTMFQEANIHHSLQASGTTELFKHEMPERSSRSTLLIGLLAVYSNTKRFGWNKTDYMQYFYRFLQCRSPKDTR